MRVIGLSSILCIIFVAGCTKLPGVLASSGPSREAVLTQSASSQQIPVLKISAETTDRLTAEARKPLLSSSFPAEASFDYRVGYGDSLEVSVWEAMPATLFGGGVPSGYGVVSTGSDTTLFSELVVARSGNITIPFAGTIPVIGKSLEAIQVDVESRLAGKANQPQVVVRLTENVSSSVTIVGEVNKSLIMPLSARGERLLDAIAAAGGVMQPADKITLQLSRGERSASASLTDVIRSPIENIPLQPGDVVTALYQPHSLTVLGATGKNDELFFEASGISLAQALARAGGLDDSRADAHGVFVFRFDNSGFVTDVSSEGTENHSPVVFQLDLKDPTAFLLARNFPMRDGDVLYVSNAPGSDLEKFLRIIDATFTSASSFATASN